MGAYTKLDRYFCLFLVASLLLAIGNFAHLFCKVDYSLAFEAIHACNHLFTNHVCNASASEHQQHARHYGCCDNEDPHEHPELSPIANSDNAYSVWRVAVVDTCPFNFIDSALIFNANSIKVFQRFEESYDWFCCNETVVLTI